LPSNHLSWQWVASTFSSKPYLFNAQNVAKFAPQNAWKAWASPKTAIDLSYEQLDTMCRESADVGPEPGVHAAVQEPALLSGSTEAFWKEIGLLPGTKPHKFAIELIVNQLQSQLSSESAKNLGAAVELVHPWALHERNSSSPALRVGVIERHAHLAHPWSLQRWRFVITRMQQICDVIWMDDPLTLRNLPGWPPPDQVQAQHTLFADYRQSLPQLARLQAEPRLFPNPQTLCGSFTRYFERVRREQPDFSKLL
jgi:deoxyribodipyrimidine photo-lyase